MQRSLLTLFAAVALLLGGLLIAQGKPQIPADKPGDPPPRLKGQLPPNFRKLGLSEEQVQRIYRIQADYDAKYEALEAQIKKLKIQERQDIEKVLTDAQRARLKEILKERDGP
jgi:hypothetical protein